MLPQELVPLISPRYPTVVFDGGYTIVVTDKGNNTTTLDLRVMKIL
jgi:hypothetical protein